MPLMKLLLMCFELPQQAVQLRAGCRLLLLLTKIRDEAGVSNR